MRVVSRKQVALQFNRKMFYKGMLKMILVNNEADPAMVHSPFAGVIASLSRLAVKRGFSLGNLSREDFMLTLAFSSTCIPCSTPTPEAEATSALVSWLEIDGLKVRTDAVTLRRALIDEKFWTRDSFGYAYSREPLPNLHPAILFMTCLNSLDARLIVAGFRRRDELERFARRNRYSAKPSD